jgi:hypothetical protein
MTYVTLEKAGRSINRFCCCKVVEKVDHDWLMRRMATVRLFRSHWQVLYRQRRAVHVSCQLGANSLISSLSIITNTKIRRSSSFEGSLSEDGIIWASYQFATKLGTYLIAGFSCSHVRVSLLGSLVISLMRFSYIIHILDLPFDEN